MSTGKGARVSIPESVRKMIHSIHEITAAHEDEIYATLKDCSMDPNETAQRLLSQDTFHEVKRKRDRRKENSSNKESVESRWKPGQGQGSRGGRVIHSSRYTSNDNSGKNSSIGKENITNQASEKSTGLSSSSASQEQKKNEATAASSSASAIPNGPSVIVGKGTKADVNKFGPAPHENLDIVKEIPRENPSTWKTYGSIISCSTNDTAAETPVTSPPGHFSSLDPVLGPSDERIPGTSGTIKQEGGFQRTPAEQTLLSPSEGKTIAAISEVGSSSMEGNIIQNKSIGVGVGKNHPPDTATCLSSSHGGSSMAWRSSNHSNCSQQLVGPPKAVVPAKEWKPKSTNPSIAQGSSATSQSDVSVAMEVQSHPITGNLDSKEACTKLQRKLEELHISDSQHVILPNHLLVPGAEKISFCFGSFDAISINTGFKNVPDDSIPAPPLETCQSVEEKADQTSSLQTAVATAKGGYHDHHQSLEHVSENLLPGEHDVPSGGSQEYGESMHDSNLPQESHHYPPVHTSPGYGFGFMPTMMESQLPTFENSESQAHDVSRIPSFFVPQPFDPVSFYQYYRSAADGDGRISPLHAAAGVATKYNGSAAVLPPLTSHSAQEGGNSSVTPTSGSTAFVTQPAAGIMPSSIPVTQQPVPVFRQPFGIPFPYPPNFLSYGPYLSPYFVPPFNNGTYPQQPQAGGIYPPLPGPAPKFSISQYKAVTSSGNSTSVGVANSYGSYIPSASTAGNSATNEDFTAQQFKESNVYITGQQQSEGTAVWLTQPGGDMSGVQANSFYNIPYQGQVAFPQHQPGHGPFTGSHHTAQAVSATTGHPLLQQSQTMASAVDIAGPASNVYQQPQHAQVTWPNNNF